jgi:hypothetical protein
MTSAEIKAHAAYLTETQQKIRRVGLDADLYARVREEVESSDEYRRAPESVRVEVLSALEARRINIAKLGSAI